MRSMLKFALPIALTLALQPAQAQVVPLGWETVVTLTQADLDMIKATLANQIHNHRSGTSAAWHNPQTGNFGSVTLLKVFSRQGRRCEQIEYRMSPPQKAPSDRFVLTSCVQPDRSWKLE